MIMCGILDKNLLSTLSVDGGWNFILLWLMLCYNCERYLWFITG